LHRRNHQERYGDVLDLVRLGTLSWLATHGATATREDAEWAVTVDGVGTTRAGTLEDAGPLAADMVAARLGVDPATVRVVVRTRLPEEIADAIEFVDLIHRFTYLAARAMACVRELAAGGLLH
jgi:hypothetical protein